MLATCGIGMVEAAAQTTELINRFKPGQILFVGSAGSVRKTEPLLSFFGATSVILADSQLVKKAAYLPEIAKTSHSADESLQRSILALSCNPQAASVYSPLGISRDEDLGTLYGSALGSYFENLELFGVAAACARKGLPWGCLSCVTNYIGAESHSQWQEHFRIAAQKTSSAMEELFS